MIARKGPVATLLCTISVEFDLGEADYPGQRGSALAE